MRKHLLSLASVLFFLQFTQAQNNPPVAVNDTVDALEQVPLLIDVLSNDYDPDGDSVILYYVDPIGSAEAHIEDQKIWFKSDNNPGEEQVYYKIHDEHSYTMNDLGRVIVNLLPNPKIPVASADTFQLMELIPHTIDLLANDYDPDGDEFIISKITNITGCNVSLSSDSLTVSVVPFKPVCSFKYRIRELTAEAYISHLAQVVIYSIENPDRPIAMPDSALAIGGIPILIPVLGNDIDPQGDEFQIKDIIGPQNGYTVLTGDSIQYTPFLSFTGQDSFSYTICESGNTGIYSYPANVKIEVSKNPDCPVGVPDTVTGMTGVSMIIDVLANDYDQNGDEIAILDVTNGTITGDNKISYKSSNLTLGRDSIYYRVTEMNNPESFSELVKVSINLAVNPDLPVAVPDFVTTRAGMPVEIRPLENDIKNSYDTLILNFAIPVRPYQGMISHENGIVRYSPAYAASGVQKIKYFIKGNASNEMLAQGEININIISQHYYDSLNINNIVAGVNASGNLFSFIMESPEGYINAADDLYNRFRVPASGNAHTIFYNYFMLGGYDSEGKVHLCATSEGWKAGPVSENQDSAYYIRYARVWKLTRQEVEYHKNNYNSAGYEPIEAITTWPGNGNTLHGEAALLAPFYDLNSNGIYEYILGDYPLIRGDQCIFLMCHDNELKVDPTVLPLMTELHIMVYGYNEPSDTALYNTVFVHYDIVNRSENTYYNTYTGVYTDFDIGLSDDDYLRTDVMRSSVFCYNGYDLDGNGYEFTYGDNPPAQSLTVLAGPYLDSNEIDNPTGECDESINGFNFNNTIIDDERFGLSRGIYFKQMEHSIWGNDPLTWLELYGFMNGIWDDETEILYGGNGHETNGATGPQARFMFPGDSDPLNFGTNCEYPANGYNQGGKFWTEEQEGNIAGDRRALASMGPFTFAPGQVQEIELAYCTGLGNNGAMSSVNQLLRNIDSLRSAVAQGKIIVPNGSLGFPEKQSVVNVSLYPNPATDVVMIANLPTNSDVEYTIYNIYGSKLAHGVLTGSRQSVKVSNLAPGLYIIHIACGNSVSTGKFVKR